MGKSSLKLEQKPEKLSVTETNLKGVFLIVPKIYRDERGYFFDSYGQEELKKYNWPHFVQQSQSLSRQGVVRGLHFQKPPHAQAKLVRVLKGRILDVVLDIRKGSPTYGQYSKIELSESNFKQIFIPEGFAHGFSILSKKAIVLYNLSKPYTPSSEGGVSCLDPMLAIDWKVKEITTSEKDKKWPKLQDLGDIFIYNTNNDQITKKIGNDIQ